MEPAAVDHAGGTFDRTLVMGAAGAGKSVLAATLGAAVGTEVVHLDRYYWSPGWRAPDEAPWRTVQARLVEGERWILDGNYVSTADLRLARATCVLVVDLPPVLCALRVLGRRLRHLGHAQPFMAEGCPERLDRNTLPLLRYVIRYRTATLPRVLAAIERHGGPDLTVVHLRSRADVRTLVDAVTRPPGLPDQASSL